MYRHRHKHRHRYRYRHRDRYRYRHIHRDRDIGWTIRRWTQKEDPGIGNPGAERNLGRRTQGGNTVRKQSGGPRKEIQGGDPGGANLGGRTYRGL